MAFSGFVTTAISVCGWRSNHRTTIQEPVALRRQLRIKGCHDVCKGAQFLPTGWQMVTTFPI